MMPSGPRTQQSRYLSSYCATSPTSVAPWAVAVWSPHHGDVVSDTVERGHSLEVVDNDGDVVHP
jgi:hypothetical protein